jgi:hypothetical protein
MELPQAIEQDAAGDDFGVRRNLFFLEITFAAGAGEQRGVEICLLCKTKAQRGRNVGGGFGGNPKSAAKEGLEFSDHGTSLTQVAAYSSTMQMRHLR